MFVRGVHFINTMCNVYQISTHLKQPFKITPLDNSVFMIYKFLNESSKAREYKCQCDFYFGNKDILPPDWTYYDPASLSYREYQSSSKLILRQSWLKMIFPTFQAFLNTISNQKYVMWPLHDIIIIDRQCLPLTVLNSSYAKFGPSRTNGSNF